MLLSKISKVFEWLFTSLRCTIICGRHACFYAFIRFCLLHVAFEFQKNAVRSFCQPWWIDTAKSSGTLTLPYVDRRGGAANNDCRIWDLYRFHPSFHWFAFCWLFIEFNFWGNLDSFCFDCIPHESKRMLWMSTHYTHKKARKIPHSNTIIHFHHHTIIIIITYKS